MGSLPLETIGKEKLPGIWPGMDLERDDSLNNFVGIYGDSLLNLVLKEPILLSHMGKAAKMAVGEYLNTSRWQSLKEWK